MCLGIESNVFEDGEQQSNFRSNSECEIGICNMLAEEKEEKKVEVAIRVFGCVQA